MTKVVSLQTKIKEVHPGRLQNLHDGLKMKDQKDKSPKQPYDGLYTENYFHDLKTRPGCILNAAILLLGILLPKITHCC